MPSEEFRTTTAWESTQIWELFPHESWSMMVPTAFNQTWNCSYDRLNWPLTICFIGVLSRTKQKHFLQEQKKICLKAYRVYTCCLKATYEANSKLAFCKKMKRPMPKVEKLVQRRRRAPKSDPTSQGSSWRVGEARFESTLRDCSPQIFLWFKSYILKSKWGPSKCCQL